MSQQLIITEKPSAARRLAQALAEDKVTTKTYSGVKYYEIRKSDKKIVIVPAVGHLFTLAEKRKSFKYPVFDLVWKPVYKAEKNSKYTKKYADTIEKEAKKSNSFVVACDYDIEGEVIGLNVVRFLCNQKDAKRMKFSTLTKPDLVQSYSEMSNSLDWGQAKAGETRHHLDWIYGVNLSRALTLAIRNNKTYRTMSSGRVQGPTLRILVEREKEIQKFKPKKYWQINLITKEKIEAWHKKSKLWKENQADEILKKTKGKAGKISRILKRKKKKFPPYPFDLTTLQTETYGVLGIRPKMTLDLAQDLYSKGLISYPRTSSQQLSPKIGYKKIIKNLAKQTKYSQLGNKLLEKKSLVPNNGKKTDPAHPAIYPTGMKPKKLNNYQKKIYDLIVKRFFATFGDVAIRENMKVTIDVNSELFIARGKRTLESGWFDLYDPYVKLKDIELPELKEGQILQINKINKLEKETKPPKRYTQASIIHELEKRNLGTKATRAQILESLYDREYVLGKSIEATELGIKTIETLHKYCPEIIEEELTKQFEEEMQEIREKETTPKKIIEIAETELRKILRKFKTHEKEIGKELAKAYIETEKERTFVGKCPKCKKGELHIMYSKKNKSRFIACDGYPDCKTTFSIPNKGEIKTTDEICESCGYPIISIRKKKIPKKLCINPVCESKKPDTPEQKKEEQEILDHIVEEECPKCKQGQLVVKKSLYGHFLACNRFPKCRYTKNIKDIPLKEDFEKKKS